MTEAALGGTDGTPALLNRHSLKHLPGRPRPSEGSTWPAGEITGKHGPLAALDFTPSARAAGNPAPPGRELLLSRRRHEDVPLRGFQKAPERARMPRCEQRAAATDHLQTCGRRSGTHPC
jgi:hypothetical protein